MERKEEMVGSQVEKVEGMSSMSIIKAARTARTRRLIQRRAPGRRISSRTLSAASSWEGEFSTSKTTFSTSLSAPDK
jgi:hypothetical protein